VINARMTFDKESLKPLYQLVIGEAGESHGRERNAIGKGGLTRTKEAGQRGRTDAHDRSGASAHGRAFPKQSRDPLLNHH
jgi:hypothetical protein